MKLNLKSVGIGSAGIAWPAPALVGRGRAENTRAANRSVARGAQYRQSAIDPAAAWETMTWLVLGLSGFFTVILSFGL